MLYRLVLLVLKIANLQFSLIIDNDVGGLLRDLEEFLEMTPWRKIFNIQ